MSMLLIRQALESAVLAIDPTFATAWENVVFKPVAGTPYQVVTLIPAEPDNPASGGAFTREEGFLQIVLKYPAGGGPALAATKAEAIKAVFKRTASFVKSGVTVIIAKTPQVASGFTDADRWCVPIRIRYFSNLLN